MIKDKIRQLVEKQITEDGLIETGIKGVHLFKVTEAVPCAPAIYEPTLVVILKGSKEAIVNGDKYIYDSDQYLCCSVPMPVEAGTPEASTANPLLGVYISLDTTVMTELVMEMENITDAAMVNKSSTELQGLSFAHWDDTFSDALFRLVQLGGDKVSTHLLGKSRLRELYYAVLQGEAGLSIRRAFGIGNKMARSIEYLSSNLTKNVTIDELASNVGMSRAVFHRKFKQSTQMSPIQFIKCMRLNHAAMQITAGKNVNQAAMAVGYVSSSQFSREFKRAYGQSPKLWSQSKSKLNSI